MTEIAFKQVDVFSSQRYHGNPLAVVLDASNLSTVQMQRMANWTNLSETTFVVPPTEAGADYQVRIFTPHDEVPFAGHPTIGTAHALLEAGLIVPRNGRLVQQCAVGLVQLAVTNDGWISFELPEPKILPIDVVEFKGLETVLKSSFKTESPPLVVNVGPRWIVAQMADAQSVLAVQPDFQLMSAISKRLNGTGVTIFGEYPAGGPARIEARAFAPLHGINEDPVCGSGTGSIGAFIRHHHLTSHLGSQFLVSQGKKLGRSGLIRLSINEKNIQVGGRAVTCIDGRFKRRMKAGYAIPIFIDQSRVRYI